jgi:long-chain acyl-CoA synthetase
MNFLEVLPQSNHSIVLRLADTRVSKEELRLRIDHYKQRFEHLEVSRVGMMLCNGLDWIAVDLACLELDICLIPIPTFFSPQQVSHSLSRAAVRIFICDVGNLSGDLQDNLANLASYCDVQQGFCWYYLGDQIGSEIPKGTNKITYTSGSTGTPKGVCLSTQTQLAVAQSLLGRIDIVAPRHLCLLPLAVLLENIAGLYAPLLAGGEVILLAPEKLGFSGSQLTEPALLLQAITRYQPNTLILVPEILLILLNGIRQGWQAPSSLQFIAVGGAKVSQQLLQQARHSGLPVYQGYGLSECTSVVALASEKSPLGSVGQLLSHCEGRVVDGQWVATANLFLGYLGQPETFYPTEFNTGDLVSLDEQGEMTIDGRSKSLIINSFGRNIQPEWLEAELMATGLLRFAAVIGEALPNISAILVPLDPSYKEDQLQIAIDRINANLPDYAQIKGFYWLPDIRQLSPLLTANNRPKRELFEQTFNQQRVNESPYFCNEIAHLNPIIKEVPSMKFFDRLQDETRDAQQYLLNAPIIARCLTGDVSVDEYVTFLQQAYHHVKHTVPLLMAAGSRISSEQEWIRNALAEYIEEELGHQEWVLNDIAACGYDKEVARNSSPHLSTELMVSYAYDSINRVSPLCFFGMVHVLEGTSIALADKVAQSIKQGLNLPANAFSYLVSHGALDLDHVKFFEGLMNKIECPEQQALIIKSTKAFYHLYGDIFRNLNTNHGIQKAA